MEYQVFTENAPAIPARKRGGGARPEKFPFSTLEVGQWFMIPVSEKHPEPWKSYQSTVSGAQRRFATVTDEVVERKNKKGETVKSHKLIHNRKFSIYKAELQDGMKVAIVRRMA